MPHRPIRPVAIAAGSLALVLSSLTVAGSPVAATTGPTIEVVDPDPESALSHFLCYRGKMRGFASDDAVRISYSDFFSSGEGDIGEGRRFCNPVEKKKGATVLAPIVSRRQHLKLYDVDRPEVPSFIELVMKNQFGSFEMEILDRPLGMFVPTRKFPHTFPRGLDHFNCHAIVKGGDVDLRFKLHDQFRRYKKMRVTEARWLCAPVDKTHDGRDFDARTPGAYLLCYDVSDRHARPKRKRLTSNQFERRRRIVAKRTTELCVPSSLTGLAT